jgi:hypothetical protein
MELFVLATAVANRKENRTLIGAAIVTANDKKEAERVLRARHPAVEDSDWHATVYLIDRKQLAGMLEKITVDRDLPYYVLYEPRQLRSTVDVIDANGLEM